MKLKKIAFIENTFKNVLVIFLLFISSIFFRASLLEVDPAVYDAILLVSSLLIASFIFADYLFTYKETDISDKSQRFLSHFLAAFIMYGTGSVLEISSITMNLKVGGAFLPFEFLMTLFYISLIMYDYWDLNRAFLEKS